MTTYFKLTLATSLLALALPFAAAAQVGGRPACDVEDIEIEAPAGVETPAERVARLERALNASLNRHDECLQNLSASTAGGNAGAGGSVASGSATGTGTGTGSTSASEADAQAGLPDSSEGQTDVATIDREPQDISDLQDRTGPLNAGAALDNGAIPKDIPPGDDDDVVAQQIREAALAESDPEVRARLWNDYRRYTGLPAVTAASSD